MKTIKLDFSKCQMVLDLHDVLKTAFLFPNYYGRNWSALWDCGKDYIEGPVRIEVYGIEGLPANWQDELGVMKRIFDRLAENEPGLHFVYIN